MQVIDDRCKTPRLGTACTDVCRALRVASERGFNGTTMRRHASSPLTRLTLWKSAAAVVPDTARLRQPHRLQENLRIVHARVGILHLIGLNLAELQLDHPFKDWPHAACRGYGRPGS